VRNLTLVKLFFIRSGELPREECLVLQPVSPSIQ